MKLINFSDQHITELNTWQELERKNGEYGINDFIVAEGTLLGDYIKFFTSEIDLISKVAIDDNQIVGFVCYDLNEENSAHVEIMGTNPNFRGKGYARKILQTLKEELAKTLDIKKLTLAVNKRNKQGIKSFSKFTKANEEHSSDNYIGMEL